MRSQNMFVWRNLVAHPLRSILTALAITLGVAMVLAAAIVGQAAGQSASELAAEGPQVDLEVFSHDETPFDAAVLDTLQASPAVEWVSPSLRVAAEGVRPAVPPLTLLGVDPAVYQILHEPALAGGTFLDEPATIVLPVIVAIQNSLYIGDEIVLQAGGNTVTLVVAGRLQSETGVEAMAGELDIAFVPLDVAQFLRFGSGQAPDGPPAQLDHVEVALRPGVDVEQVRAELAQTVDPNLAVVRAVAAGGVLGNVVLVQAGLVVVGLIILFAASFVILNAFAMSVTGRTREIAALRALGMTRRQVMRTVLAEAGLLGLGGAIVGIGAGLGLAWVVMQAMGTLEDAPFVVPWWGLLLSALMGLLVTLVAALQPAWRASRVSPIVAARPETTAAAGWYLRFGGRLGGGLLGLLLPGLLIVGLLLRPGVFSAQVAVVAAQAALLGAAVLLLPALIDPLTTLCRPLLVRWLGTAGRLAADNLGRNKLRAVLTVGALTAGLTIIVATSGLMTAALKGALSRLGSMLQEDSFITVNLPEAVASGKVSVENFFQVLTEDPDFDLTPVVTALDPLVEAGIIEVERNRFGPVPAELTAMGIPGVFVDIEIFLRIDNYQFFEGDSETAWEWMQRGPAVLLLPIVAERLGVQVGDRIPVQTPHGEVDFTVAGIGGSGYMMTVLNYADGETYFDIRAPTHLGIVVAEGQDVAAAMAQVREALEPFPEMAMSYDFDNPFVPVVDMVGQLELLVDALVLLAIIVAALGVVNTMVINVAERRREIGLLRAVGATQRQVRQAVLAEAATLGLLAALVAAGLGLLMVLTWGLLTLPHGVATLGVRPDWETIRLTMGAGLADLGIAAAVSLLFGPLVASLAAYYPARQAAALDVVEATRSERVTLKPAGGRRPEGRRLTRAITWTMAWRNLAQAKTRTILSALAVASGVAMVSAIGVVSSGIRGAWGGAESEIAWFAETIDYLLGIAAFFLFSGAGFLVFNAFAMAVTQRRRQIGAMRSLGMTRRQVLQLVLAEALFIGGLGTLLGLVGGPLLGRVVLAVIRQTGVESGASQVSLPGMVGAAVMGLGISLLSALLPARRAARVSPLAALRGPTPLARAERGRTSQWVGWVLLIGLLAYLVVAPPAEWAGMTPPWDKLMPALLWLVWLAALGCLVPSWIAGLIHLARGPANRFGGTTGRLVVDNAGRAPRRLILTVLSFAVGLAMIIGLGGLAGFNNEVALPRMVAKSLQQTAWYVHSFDLSSGVVNLGSTDQESLRLDPAVVEAVHRLAAGRAYVGESYSVLVPELAGGLASATSPSYILDLADLKSPGNCTFSEGDWATATPLLEEGCGLLLPATIAGRLKVGTGDTVTVQGKDGPVGCTVAGIALCGFGPSAVIAMPAKDAFVGADRSPDMLSVRPLPGTDRAALEADLRALADRHDDVWITEPQDEVDAIVRTSDQAQGMVNGLMLLAEVTAAFGMINTMMMNVAERRRELGLFRAVGATRRQVTAVVLAEAALMGLIGVVLGATAGLGLAGIWVLAVGGYGFGLVDLPLWPSAGEMVLPALRSGWAAMVAVPLLAAAAAYPAVRAILRGSAIETLEPARQQLAPARRAVVGFLRRGSIRNRFVLGTAALLLLVLAGLIGSVRGHERSYLEDQMGDALSSMVQGQASLIELSLPQDAQVLDLPDLQAVRLDSDALLRFQALVDDLSEFGLERLLVADRDNVVLFSLDPREMGTVLAPLESPGGSAVSSEREEGAWRMQATAPIYNQGGLLLGSVRLTANLAVLQDFLDRTSNALWAVGGGIIAFGLVISWLVATPLVRTRRLVDPTAREEESLDVPGSAEGGVGQSPGRPRSDGPPAHSKRGGAAALASRVSLRARLTVVMVLIVVLLVGVLESAVVPIERRHCEAMLKDSLVAGSEWLGQVLSEGLGTEPEIEIEIRLEELLEKALAFDWAKLRELIEDTRSEDIVYVAVVDQSGRIVLSDQLALYGEPAPLPAKTHLEEDRWRDEEVWVVSTPLRRGQEGEQVGALRVGVRRVQVEVFLDESRTLFRLTGMIALLAGVLLAQGIGGVVTAPKR